MHAVDWNHIENTCFRHTEKPADLRAENTEGTWGELIGNRFDGADVSLRALGSNMSGGETRSALRLRSGSAIDQLGMRAIATGRKTGSVDCRTVPSATKPLRKIAGATRGSSCSTRQATPWIQPEMALRPVLVIAFFNAPVVHRNDAKSLHSVTLPRADVRLPSERTMPANLALLHLYPTLVALFASAPYRRSRRAALR